MDNSLTLKFVRVTTAYAHGIPFHTALEAAMALGDPHERERNINAGMPDPIIVRLERLQPRSNFISGELIRKQIANIPPEANDDGLTPINLSEGGGLGLSSAFRYHRPTRVLLIQANNQAVSIGRLNLYLNAIDANAQYTFDPVPRADAWTRFNSGLPRRLVLKVASPDHIPEGSALDNEARTVGDGLATMSEALRGALITVEISMGRRGGSLLKGATERVLRSFRRMKGDGELDVRMLSAAVTDDHGTDVIDFLDEHLVIRDRLDLPDGNPDRNYQLRATYLETTFNAQLHYIHDHYG